MFIPFISNIETIEEKKLIGLIGPSTGKDGFQPVQRIYDQIMEKMGPCLTIGVGHGIPVFVRYLQARTHFFLMFLPYGIFVRTNITIEYYLKIVKDLEAQEYLDDLANKRVGNTPDNSIITYCPVTETHCNFYLLFKNQDTPKSEIFNTLPNLGFHLKSFITGFNLGKVIKCIIQYLLKSNHKICVQELDALQMHLVGSESLCDSTKRWLLDYGTKLVLTIVTLFVQAFVISGDVIYLKTGPEENPSDERLCLEILKVQEITSTLPQILGKLPDFCRSRIQNLSDLEHYFRRFPDLLPLPSKPKKPDSGTWKHIKNELSSLTSASAFIDEESIEDLEQLSTRIRDLADKVQAFHLTTCNEQMQFHDLKPIEQLDDDDSVIDIT